MTSGFPSLDAVFELLSSHRRRYALYCLTETEAESVLTLDAVTDRVVAWEREWGDGRLGETDGRDAVRIDLHHNHLPRLADTGFVEYDARTETIRNWNRLPICDWVREERDERRRLRALFGIDEPSEEP